MAEQRLKMTLFHSHCAASYMGAQNLNKDHDKKNVASPRGMNCSPLIRLARHHCYLVPALTIIATRPSYSL
ncbi:hypothetical protein VNO77_44806 [Canavalia gladiata]|uniref:Uncharacterized protein n=1 Tax=Canavalia gladiata TaxID=3824 RepID=A0AAN9PQM9_CANGL